MDNEIVSLMAQMMAKTLKTESTTPGRYCPCFAETLCRGVEMTNSTKRKWADGGPEPQRNNLIEENFHVVNDGHMIVGWTAPPGTQG